MINSVSIESIHLGSYKKRVNEQLLLLLQFVLEVYLGPCQRARLHETRSELKPV